MILEDFIGRHVSPGSDKEYKLYLQSNTDGTYTTHAFSGKTGNCNTPQHKYTGPSLVVAQQHFKEMMTKKKTQSKPYVGVHTVYNQGSPTPYATMTTGPAGLVAAVTAVAPTKQSSGHSPHLLKPIDEAFALRLRRDDRYWLMQKFDGIRCAIEHSSTITSGINRKGQYISVPPETLAAVQRMFASYDQIMIDCELVGNTLYVFDLLELDSTNFRAEKLEDRYGTLEQVFAGARAAVPYITLGVFAKTTAEKEYFHTVLRKGGDEGKVEGEVYKDKEAPYVNGARCDTQYKLKYWKTATVMCHEITDKSSFVMSMFDLTNVAKTKIWDPIIVGRCTRPTNKPMPAVGDLVEVKYHSAYKGGSLTQTEYIVIRTDLDEDAADISQLIFKETLA